MRVSAAPCQLTARSRAPNSLKGVNIYLLLVLWIRISTDLSVLDPDADPDLETWNCQSKQITLDPAFQKDLCIFVSTGTVPTYARVRSLVHQNTRTNLPSHAPEKGGAKEAAESVTKCINNCNCVGS